MVRWLSSPSRPRWAPKGRGLANVGEAFKKMIPTRRFAQPEEIALAALYLVSGAAGMINGENLVVDGGYTAT